MKLTFKNYISNFFNNINKALKSHFSFYEVIDLLSTIAILIISFVFTLIKVLSNAGLTIVFVYFVLCLAYFILLYIIDVLKTRFERSKVTILGRKNAPNKYVPNIRNRVQKTYGKPGFQTIVYTTVILCTLFSLLTLFVTTWNALKPDRLIIANIFSAPDAKTFFQDVSYNFSNGWKIIKDSFLRSIIISIAGAALDCIFGAILAYIFTYKNIYFKEVIFTIFISVMLLPSIMGMPILVPFMTNVLKLEDTIIGYLLPMLAGGQVTALFLFRTFFGQQPKALFESAQVEGANDFHIFLKITFPLAFPIIMYKFVGTFSSLYNDYVWASLILTSNRTMMTEIINLQSNPNLQLGILYAIYVMSSVPLVITSIISMKYFSSGDFAAGMKL